MLCQHGKQGSAQGETFAVLTLPAPPTQGERYGLPSCRPPRGRRRRTWSACLARMLESGPIPGRSHGRGMVCPPGTAKCTVSSTS